MKYLSYTIFKEKIEEKHADKALSFSFDGEARKRSKLIIRKEKEMKKEEAINEQDLLFNHLFKEIIDSKKPMIVHNGFLDLMHVCFNGSRSFSAFRSLFRTLGPNTKGRSMPSFLIFTITNTSSPVRRLSTE